MSTCALMSPAFSSSGDSSEQQQKQVIAVAEATKASFTPVIAKTKAIFEKEA